MNDHCLTNKEKYLLKKQRKEQERFERTHRKKIKKIIGISLLVILIVGGAIFVLANYFLGKNQGTPKIEINPQEYDAGIVSMAEGLVEYTYEIRNNGDGDLKIKSIETSCMCTTAVLKVGDKTSPEFGMHSNLRFWSQKITPGQIGYLEVTFDPAFHGSRGIGQNIRAVYLSTNDPQNKGVQVRLSANVVK